jgi:hypothetical protein
MEHAHTSPISGSVTLTFGDNISILLTQFPTFICRLTVFLGIVFTAAALIGIGLDSRLSLREDPATAVSTAIREIWPFMAGSLVLIVAIVVICSTIKWGRYPAENKRVTYTADDSGITTSDAAGASVHVPWSMIKHSRRTKRHVVMKTTPGGLRFLPFRAFSPDDGERLWRLVRAKTPVK